MWTLTILIAIVVLIVLARKATGRRWPYFAGIAILGAIFWARVDAYTIQSFVLLTVALALFGGAWYIVYRWLPVPYVKPVTDWIVDAVRTVWYLPQGKNKYGLRRVGLEDRLIPVSRDDMLASRAPMEAPTKPVHVYDPNGRVPGGTARRR